MIYKVLRQEEWEELKSSGSFSGSAHDQRDGFIHFATGEQLSQVLEKYFKDLNVYIVGVDENELKRMGEDLKWENGYPHLYGAPLKIKHVKGARAYPES